MQKDPIGLASGDHNFYRYVFNEPWGYTDPMGLWGEGFAQWISNQGLGAVGDGAAGVVAAVGGAVEGGVVGAVNTVVGAVQSVGLAAGTIVDGVGIVGELTGAWRYDADLTPQTQHLAEQGSNVDVGKETQAYSERALVGIMSLGATEILYGLRNYDSTGDEQVLSRHMGGIALGAVLVKGQASKPGAPPQGPNVQPKPGQVPVVQPSSQCGGSTVPTGGGTSSVPTTAARFIADSVGNIVDTHATPPGRYIQPNRSATDILQRAEHPGLDPFVARTHTHPAIVNQRPGNTSQGSTRLGEPRPVTTEEVLNIINGRATPSKPKGR
jgi:hypothetical protein